MFISPFESIRYPLYAGAPVAYPLFEEFEAKVLILKGATDSGSSPYTVIDKKSSVFNVGV
jgi:hypothetical protein